MSPKFPIFLFSNLKHPQQQWKHEALGFYNIYDPPIRTDQHIKKAQCKGHWINEPTQNGIDADVVFDDMIICL
jgi:hypothetical protein